MKISIDKEKCIMAGECYYNHPEILKMGDEGFPLVLIDVVDNDEQMRHAREAAEVCPAGAISIEDS